MTATNGRRWVEHKGPLPAGFDKIPLGGQGKEDPRPGFQSGTVWARTGAGLVLRCDPLPVHVGAGVAVGDISGDAVVITPQVADTAVTDSGGATGDGFYRPGIDPGIPNPPADVQNVLDPSGAGVQQGMAPRYAQFKSPPNAEVWRFSFPEGYTQGKGVNQSVLQPIPGSPNPNPGPGPGCPAGQVKDSAGNCVPAGSPGTSTSAKVLPWVLVAAGAVLVGTTAYAIAKHKPKPRENPVKGKRGGRK